MRTKKENQWAICIRTTCMLRLSIRLLWMRRCAFASIGRRPSDSALHEEVEDLRKENEELRHENRRLKMRIDLMKGARFGTNG